MSGIEDYARKLGAEWDEEEPCETGTTQFRRAVRNIRRMLSNMSLSPEEIIEDPEIFSALANGIAEGTGFPRDFSFGLLVGAMFNKE